MTDAELSTAADTVFLALCVWREARGEPIEGKSAVAGTVINRIARPSWWGRTVCEVLFKKWQYSSLTDPKDRQLTTWPHQRSESWQECLRVADGVLAGRLTSIMPGADSYYDVSIDPPKWATPDTHVGQIGRLHFYNLDRDIEA